MRDNMSFRATLPPLQVVGGGLYGTVFKVMGDVQKSLDDLITSSKQDGVIKAIHNGSIQKLLYEFNTQQVIWKSIEKLKTLHKERHTDMLRVSKPFVFKTSHVTLSNQDFIGGYSMQVLHGIPWDHFTFLKLPSYKGAPECVQV